MKTLLDTGSGIIAVLAFAFAIWEFFAKYKTSASPEGDVKHLYIAIAAAVVGCACGLVFFLRRVNKEEEIHITQ